MHDVDNRLKQIGRLQLFKTHCPSLPSPDPLTIVMHTPSVEISPLETLFCRLQKFTSRRTFDYSRSLPQILILYLFAHTTISVGNAECHQCHLSATGTEVISHGISGHFSCHVLQIKWPSDEEPNQWATPPLKRRRLTTGELCFSAFRKAVRHSP